MVEVLSFDQLLLIQMFEERFRGFKKDRIDPNTGKSRLEHPATEDQDNWLHSICLEYSSQEEIILLL